MQTDIRGTKVIVLLTVLVALSAAMAVWFVMARAAEPPEGMITVNVYRLNIHTGALVPRTHFVAEGDRTEMAQDVFAIFMQPSADALNLRTTYPDGLTLLDAQLITSQLMGASSFVVDFSADYHDMTPSDELYFRSSLVWTMTDLDFISDVHILIEGEEHLRSDGTPMGALSRANVAVSPQISPVRVDFERITIYFLDREELALVAEERLVRINPERPIENYYIEALIEGPRSERLSPTVPAETRLRADVQTNDGTAYVNLSGDFVSRSAGSPEVLRLNILSIVNSLTEIRDIQRVQFLIESEKVDNLRGFWELHVPIERDETVIAARPPSHWDGS